jgi:hypothetical protein
MNVQKIVIHKLPDLRNAIHDGFTQISTMSVSCPGPVGSNGSSTSFLHASDDYLDLVLWKYIVWYAVQYKLCLII